LDSLLVLAATPFLTLPSKNLKPVLETPYNVKPNQPNNQSFLSNEISVICSRFFLLGVRRDEEQLMGMAQKT
jgi:hypothetical protein